MARDDSPRLNGASPRHDSPRRYVNPNIRTQRDLEKALEALVISDQEHQKIHVQQQKLLAENAELKEVAYAKALEAQQEQTRAQQEQIRQQAQAALQKWQEDQEREQARRREAERIRIEKEEAEQIERDRQIRVEQERLRREAQARADAEAARKRQEQQEAAEAEARRRRKEDEAIQKKAEAQKREEELKRQADEQRKQQLAEREFAAKARREADQRAQAQAQSAKQDEGESPDAIHDEYLALYQKAKTWKNEYWEFVRKQAKIHKDPAIKEMIADTRRTITGEVGKLSDDKDLNKMAATKIRSFIFDHLDKPTKTVGTMVSVNDFLPPHLSLNDNGAAKISDQSMYAICVLAQKAVSIMIKYAYGEPQRAESLGVMAISIFATASIQYPRQNPRTPDEATQSLFPILLAKFHKTCPALFGITAPTNDQKGRSRLGWALLPSADDDVPKTILVPENEHFDRMKGAAIGFSSLALRNFANASTRNPCPPVVFWKSLAMIINLPPEKVTATHICVMRNMFGHRGIARFMLFFGTVGHAVLREAFVEFPKRLPQEMQNDSFVKELSIFVEKLAKDEHIHLD